MSICGTPEQKPCEAGKCVHCDMGYLIYHGLSVGYEAHQILEMFTAALTKMVDVEIELTTVIEVGKEETSVH